MKNNTILTTSYTDANHRLSYGLAAAGKVRWTLLVLVIAFLSSCGKHALDLEPFDKLTPNTAFNTEKDLQLYVNSFYKILPSGNDIIRGDVLSDYGAGKSVSAYLIPGAFSATQASSWSWGDLRNVNYFLEHYQTAAIDHTRKEHFEGIARFFRAWFYYDKVQRYGDVPWYNKPLGIDDTALYKARDARSLVMDSVLADLDYACAHIDDAKDNTASQITKWVALAFKSRVCLYEGTYRKYHTELNLQGTAQKWLTSAAQAAEEVMNSHQYSIHVDGGHPALSYRELFISQEPPADETILAYVCNGDLQVFNDANWYFTSATYGNRLSFSKTFIDTYLNRDGSRYTDKAGFDSAPFPQEVKDRDLRLQQTIRMGDYKRGDGSAAPPDFTYTYTGYEPLKFTLDDKATDGIAKNTNSIPIIRYAEVLLNYAEAKAELGTFEDADWDNTIAVLRARAGITNTDMPKVADPYLQQHYFKGISDPALLEIRRERGIELALEGFRYDDLFRWKCGDLLTMPYKGIYVPEMNTLYDLNEDGKNDVCFVTKIPAKKQSGVYYYLIDNDQAKLSEGSSGNIIWLNNITRQWEDYKYYYPIDYDELVLNPNLEQNPGWDHP
ncbi:RagB/SusD family nutrient uptake outer membrane protein [Arachidicoccus terrestris]|uniref:RagB/SusD family nutrient uptake outer membrane protein n=1 Tax=Arachidicoccus terrestris TaxID=2875539 RepID=UPI001CC4F319|nr:RagB/SusD family nutrient uptake outer membrane protein [Arachidicoccus terrestris]UAY55511.1 RagB/SusD family nutrient uptake outer membrane protein [Arachidicoccus terrestris]